jgi:hypothetical protein
MTSAQFNAISQSTSSHTYNIQVPSEQTIIDRRLIWKSTVTIQLNITGVAGQFPINYGVSDALSAFPLHQLSSVMTATINNNSVSLNVRDVLPAILRFNDIRELQRYNGMTPVQYDLVGDYASAVGANLNSLGAWGNAGDNDLLPRGSFVLDAVGTTFTQATNLVSGVVPISTGVAQTVYVQFTVAEPLLISPFIFAQPQSNNQGFYGIQNMNFVVNIGDASRVWRSANSWITSASVASFANSQLIFNFLTPHPSDLMPSRNVVGYYELPHFITSNQPSIPAGGTASSAVSLTTSSIQLNQVPDKLIIMVRKPMSSQSWNDPDACLCIKGLSIQFNNQAGILASATQNDLYRYSAENGSNQSWLEFSGRANVASPATGVGRVLATSGSFLMLEFGKDIQLSEDFYSSGSIGNFNLQINLQVYNQTANAITPEIVLVLMNSGLFVCERGTSSTYTAILTKQDVLDASSQEPMYKSDAKRLVGGGFLDSLKSLVQKLLPVGAHYAKDYLDKNHGDMGKMGKKMIEALGYGSAGGHSGGKKRLSDRLM